MKLTDQQEGAVDAAMSWLDNWKKSKPVFRLFGYAGTGKTTLAKIIAAHLDGDVAFMAFMGKAAAVMRSKGCDGARTIHQSIYVPVVRESDGIVEFKLNRNSDIADVKAVIIDECSMVGEDLGRDVLSFGVPVIVIGDPAQLPPVAGTGFFTECEPDVMLDEVHRQAIDNPIIRLSMDVRAGKTLVPGDYGTSKVVRMADFDSDEMLAADQVIVGRNFTRRTLNAMMREAKGYEGPYPRKGEKMICLRNNHKRGLLNGGIWYVKADAKPARDQIVFEAYPEEGGDAVKIKLDEIAFLADQDPEADDRKSKSGGLRYDRNVATMTSAQSISCHKSQGSQWENVVVLDESHCFREHRKQWLYTAITRASEKLTLVIDV